MFVYINNNKCQTLLEKIEPGKLAGVKISVEEQNVVLICDKANQVKSPFCHYLSIRILPRIGLHWLATTRFEPISLPFPGKCKVVTHEQKFEINSWNTPTHIYFQYSHPNLFISHQLPIESEDYWLAQKFCACISLHFLRPCSFM